MSAGPASIAVRAGDGHQWTLLGQVPRQPRAQLLWLPALGVAARHYLPLAQALAAHGIATWLHEWRGHGSSSLRPSRQLDWGYRELLTQDLPASLAALPDTPVLLGGHSLGGQLACCLAGLQPAQVAGIGLVAAGSPWWRGFPAPRRWLLPGAYRLLAWIARRNGTLPGRRLGFAGTEARGLIHDWSQVGLTGRYAARGMELDLEAALAGVRMPLRAVLLEQDWLAPAGSLQALLARMPQAPAQVAMFNADALGARADHFAWMAQPGTVAASLAALVEDQKKFCGGC